MVPDTNGVEGLEVSTHAFFKAHWDSGCHDSEKQKGKFRLDNLSTDFTNSLVAEKWSEVRFRINAGGDAAGGGKAADCGRDRRGRR